MVTGLIDRLDRRGFLAVVAAALAASNSAISQTLISGTPESDFGYVRNSIAEAESQARSQIQSTQQQSALAWRPVQAPRAAMDWKKYILSGERSILMRRDGPVRRVRYCTKDGLLDRDGYSEACFLLRDVRAGKLTTMDPGLLDLLCGIQRWAEYNGHEAIIQLLSGFRSLETNTATEGAVKNSLHLYGRAADVVIDGFTSSLLGAMAKVFNVAGGTGIYVNRGFVHVDTGSHRTWISTESRRKR